MEIAGIQIPTPLALGPMAGVTDSAFRQLCRELGAGLTCTELVSAKALCYQDQKSRLLLQLNMARCAARQAELTAVSAFTDIWGNPTRTDILQALNRLSSFLYILMIQLKSKG